MRIDIDRPDFDCIIDALKGQLTKSQFKRAEELVRRLTTPHHQPKAGWAPMRIRPSWPSGITKGPRKTNQYFHKPRDKKPTVPKTPKAPPTADEILASI